MQPRAHTLGSQQRTARIPHQPLAFPRLSFPILSPPRGQLSASEARERSHYQQSIFRLEEVKVKVAQSCPTLCDPWTTQSMKSPGQNAGVGSPSLLQGIFPTQGSKPCLPHCRRILYQLSHQGNPKGSLTASLPWMGKLRLRLGRQLSQSHPGNTRWDQEVEGPDARPPVRSV